MSDLLTTALAHARRGWHVFPLQPDGKRPAVRDWENRATADPGRICRCWTAGPYGIGIACGPSGLVVVDLDVPKPGQTPPDGYAGLTSGADVLAHISTGHGRTVDVTYTVTTGRGGNHLYYQHPSRGPLLLNTAGAVGWLIRARPSWPG